MENSNKKHTITDADLHFFKDQVKNPTTGKPYSIGTIRQICYGHRKNEFVEKLLDIYFTELKPAFLLQIRQAYAKLLTDTITEQK